MTNKSETEHRVELFEKYSALTMPELMAKLNLVENSIKALCSRNNNDETKIQLEAATRVRDILKDALTGKRLEENVQEEEERENLIQASVQSFYE